MQNELHAGIVQIATFMICAQAISHFRPKESYAKYLRMLLSVMILVQIFQPFCSLFFGVSSRELAMAVEEFQERMNESMATAKEQSALAEEKLENMSLLEVQERLAEQENVKTEETDERNNKKGDTGKGDEEEISAEETDKEKISIEKRDKEELNKEKIDIENVDVDVKKIDIPTGKDY